ncbi:hypothetical protein, partial [Rhizorhabdus wittichii]|uniref:hypothetical protein n=1 Tax=Rhizorhabdus wittichii TaxID=160791 RepID=UPI001D019579
SALGLQAATVSEAAAISERATIFFMIEFSGSELKKRVARTIPITFRLVSPRNRLGLLTVLRSAMQCLLFR